MNIDENASWCATATENWHPTTPALPENPSRRTLVRRRAKARARWPRFEPDVAYALDGLPQPKRGHRGRTWAEVARDNFLADIIPGIPPWCLEAWRQEFWPTMIAPGELAAALPPEVLASLTEKERASLCA